MIKRRRLFRPFHGNLRNTKIRSNDQTKSVIYQAPVKKSSVNKYSVILSPDAIMNNISQQIDENLSRCKTSYSKWKIYSKGFDDFISSFHMNTANISKVKNFYDIFINETHDFIKNHYEEISKRKEKEQQVLDELNGTKGKMDKKKVFYQNLIRDISKTNKDIVHEIDSLNSEINRKKIIIINLTQSVQKSSAKLNALRETFEAISKKSDEIKSERKSDTHEVINLTEDFKIVKVDMIEKLDSMFQNREKLAQIERMMVKVRENASNLKSMQDEAEEKKNSLKNSINNLREDINQIESETKEEKLKKSQILKLINGLNEYKTKLEGNQEEAEEEEEKNDVSDDS
ncbi:hypothetical protein TRFO_34589 [Tritrichomonas foetus]|uniref:Uncharacterized protein n=1 Tax=Tritrichomonas foetus TaxID=1144522 RepID=A0A1J4JNK4_9EUKA|nr:hypothetical protein TRFO_34589 [Tritrichomonas foetus]|eukprot:OHS99093.1 hypothetical protein TRFO_34589 [Tritrichomonas foetus]